MYGQSICRWLFKTQSFGGMYSCHYFPPDLRSPSQSKNVGVPRPVPSYTAWWQRHIGVNNLPKVVTQPCPGGIEPTITSRMPYRYATMPLITNIVCTVLIHWLQQQVVVSDIDEDLSVCARDTFWTSLFVRHFLEVVDDSVRDDMLFYVRKCRAKSKSKSQQVEYWFFLSPYCEIMSN